MSPGPPIDAARVIADLRELERRTGGPEGARRVCWGEEWRAARAFVEELLGEIGLAPERDEAGNLWAYLEGEDPAALALGSHTDSVPGGGWLDGALGVMAAIGVLRAWAGAGERPALTLALADFADEEGSRFGRSLLGSSAVSGSLDPAEIGSLRDPEGRPAEEVLRENGVEAARMEEARARAERLAGYLELHIEQGPVLTGDGLPLAAVDGCVGIERWRFELRGQASHAGTTPMDARRDAGLAAAEAALRIEEIAIEVGGVGTTGRLDLTPGVPTAVAGSAALFADLRHPDAGHLARMLEKSSDALASAAAKRGCDWHAERIWGIEPTTFAPELVDAAAAVCEAHGTRRVLTSGALHDAAEMARITSAAMLFVPSIAGLSHAREEDTAEADLATGIEAFGELAAQALELPLGS